MYGAHSMVAPAAPRGPKTFIALEMTGGARQGSTVTTGVAGTAGRWEGDKENQAPPSYGTGPKGVEGGIKGRAGGLAARPPLRDITPPSKARDVEKVQRRRQREAAKAAAALAAAGSADGAHASRADPATPGPLTGPSAAPRTATPGGATTALSVVTPLGVSAAVSGASAGKRPGHGSIIAAAAAASQSVPGPGHHTLAALKENIGMSMGGDVGPLMWRSAVSIR
jgi:hypothetical protein